MSYPENTALIHTRFQSWMTGLSLGAVRPALPIRTPISLGLLRGWLGPLGLMIFTPVLSIMFWMACTYYDGAITQMLAADPAEWWTHFPAPSLTAVTIIAGWTLIQALLLKFLPGTPFLGPVTPEGVQPAYRLNGVLAWVVTHVGLFAVAYPLGWIDPGVLYAHFGELLITLTLGAFGFCLFLYWKGRVYPTSTDTLYTGNPVFDFFQGIELHPRLFGVNLKQLINCRVSMMAWSVIFVSFGITQYQQLGVVSTSMWASILVLVIYLFKFFWWEGGYFHSLDIMHDRFGYYICWGVLAWVPAVYCLVALWLVAHPVDWHPMVGVLMVAGGVLAIWINYQADAQRRRVRDTNGQTEVWGKAPELIHASYTTTDGETRESLLLVSGWWGVARHFHYVPELALAFAWTVPAGFTHFLPWFYLIFLFILLMDRAIRDEKRCAIKYGPYWEQYVKRVRWRVFPGIF